MPLQTELSKKLGLTYPFVLAPMFQSRYSWQAGLRNACLVPAARLMPRAAMRILDGRVLPSGGRAGRSSNAAIRPVGGRPVGEPGE